MNGAFIEQEAFSEEHFLYLIWLNKADENEHGDYRQIAYNEIFLDFISKSLLNGGQTHMKFDNEFRVYPSRYASD